MAEGGGRQQELSRAERAAGGAGRRAGAPRPQLPELLSNAGSADAAGKAQTRGQSEEAGEMTWGHCRRPFSGGRGLPEK